MQLTRDNVTSASRVMLPTYVLFFAFLGMNYLLARQTAAASPALAYVHGLMDLRVWGGVFVGCSLLMLVALLRYRRMLYRFALRFCAFAMAVWAVFIVAASLTGNATPLAAAWPAFVATACMASDRSLRDGER